MADTLFVDATTMVAGTPLVAAWHNDANTATYDKLSAVAGTNTITATGPLSMSTYSNGQNFYFSPTITNTGATTINISSLGAKAITKNGTTPLIAGDLVTGTVYELTYDGTQFQLINPSTFNLTQVIPVTNGGTGATTAQQALINLGATGRLIGTQTLSVSGNYTPTVGTTRIIAYVYAGGGAGGGAPATGGAQNSVGGGGGSGGRSVHLATSGFSGSAYVIGAGGVPVSGAAGGNGGNTTFLGITAFGGNGGLASAAGAAPLLGLPGNGGAQSTGGNILNTAGNAGTVGLLLTVGAVIVGGSGGSGELGGGRSLLGGIGAGLAGQTNASGGSGAAILASSAAQPGGAGIQGVIVVYEYS